MRSCLLLLLLVSACYRSNPRYCDDRTPCGPGLVCRMPQHECLPPGAPDMVGPGRDMAMGDMRYPDMVIPPACTRNYQCPDSACDDIGLCHERSRVAVVDDRDGCKRLGMPMSPQPYCYIREALAELGNRDVILIRPSSKGGHILPLGDFIHIENISVRLVGARTGRADPPVLVREPIRIRLPSSGQRDMTVGIEDLQIAPRDFGSVHGIDCARSFPLTDRKIALSVRWSRVDGVPLDGLHSEACSSVESISSQFIRNGGGVSLNDGELTFHNNVVAKNGIGNPSGGGVILVRPAGTPKVAFNTLVDNQCAGIVFGCNLACSRPLNPIPVSYSIAIGNVPPGRMSISGECLVSSSVVPSNYNDGMNNYKVTPNFADPAQDNYHLRDDMMNRTNLRKTAPAPLPISYDLDGDPRPSQDGRVDIGADQLVP
jgi:hypothetical protein